MSERLIEVIGSEEIRTKIRALGEDITRAYQGRSLIAVCVLKGAFMFFSDLVRCVDLDLELDFVRLASYGTGTTSGELVFSKDLEMAIRDRDVLIVEDIVDTGRSMDFLKRTFLERKPRSLAVAALVDKHERREVELTVDFPAFTLKQGFLVGYGMDYAERFRQLGAIFELDQ